MTGGQVDGSTTDTADRIYYEADEIYIYEPIDTSLYGELEGETE